MGVFAGLGVLSGLFILFSATKNLPYTVSYGIAGGVTMTAAIFLLFTVKNNNIEKKGVELLSFKDKCKVKASQLKQEISVKVELSVCLLGSVICRMLNVVTIVYINLWISTYFSRDEKGQ